MISEEPFMKFFREKKIVDMLKVRASYGEIGSDQLGPDPFDSSRRWLYMNQWAYGGHTTITTINKNIRTYISEKFHTTSKQAFKK